MSEEILTENERAKRLMAMGQMAAALAHEIRNPLGSMELFCTLLKKDLADQPESLNLAEQIHVSIRRLDRVISNCLQFAREIVPRKTAVENPLEFLEEVVEDAAPIAKDCKVELSLSGIGSGGVEIDSYQINQALLNVIINGIQAAGLAEGGRVDVRSDLSAEGSWRICVSDNGPGIPEADLERIFDPFFTTKPKGTGLGLAIVHAIIKAHGGTVSARSSSAGTEFLISLPRT